MDISPDYLAICSDGHREIITIIYSGGCVVFKERIKTPVSVHNPNMAATGTAAAYSQTSKLQGKIEGVCFLKPTFVRDCCWNFGC